jgi:hypothetical protein
MRKLIDLDIDKEIISKRENGKSVGDLGAEYGYIYIYIYKGCLIKKRTVRTAQLGGQATRHIQHDS